MNWSSHVICFFRSVRLALSLSLVWAVCANIASADSTSTSTGWRNDEANIQAVQLLNTAWTHHSASKDYEGALDDPPFAFEWSTGPNVPVCWKGGAAGVIGDDIILAGGLWMPGYQNLAYAFNTKTQEYTRLPDPIYKAEYTQGASDGTSFYIVSGRTGQNRAQKLSRNDQGAWEWSEMPSLPQSESKGRAFAAAEVVGDWLIYSCGLPHTTPDERPDYRIRLDDPNAAWEAIPACPGNPRHLVSDGAIDGRFYVFGGVRQDPFLKDLKTALDENYSGIGGGVPWNADVNFREVYAYDPTANTWEQVAGIPTPMLQGDVITVDNRFGFLMGSGHRDSYRVGGPDNESWRGYWDMIFCYDAQLDNYYRIGVMLYGVATSPWVLHDGKAYSFGGEPAHGQNLNTENVLQIGTLVRRT